MKKNNFFDLKLPDKIFGLDKSFLGLFLIPLALFLLFLISLRLILIPKMNDISTISAEIKRIKTNTTKIKEQNAYLANLDQAELERNASYLDSAVLKDKKSYLLVGIIRSVANRFNYQIDSFSLTLGEIKSDESSKIIKSGDAIRLPINLTLSGPKEESLNLILELEKTLPILFIDKFEKKDSKNLSQISLTISSYYLESNLNVEANNIALSDLILSKEELALISRISGFTKIENNTLDVGTSVNFKEYQRENPFSL